MKRCLIQQGGGTLTVSLPADWARKKQLKTGSEVSIVELRDGLFLSTNEPMKQTAVVIPITNSNCADITNILTHVYRSGFCKITFTGINESTSRSVLRTTNEKLLGFEVVRKEKNLCEVANVSEPGSEQYDVLLRRIFLIIKEVELLCLSDFSKGTFSHTEDIVDFRNQHDKLVLYCERALTKQKEHVSFSWELLVSLMHISHGYYYLYQYAAENCSKKSTLAVSLLQQLQKYYSLLYDGYYLNDIECIHKINEQKKSFQFGTCYSALRKANGTEIVVISHLRELFRLVQLASSPILSKLLARNLESPDQSIALKSPSLQE